MREQKLQADGSGGRRRKSKLHRLFPFVLIALSSRSYQVSADNLTGSHLTLQDSSRNVDLSYVRRDPDNIVSISGGGPLNSYCPLLACLLNPEPDHQRASSLFVSTTNDDGHSAEQNVALETAVRTGFARKWKPHTRFFAGDNVVFGNPRNAVFRATQTGISATTGNGPSGKSEDIVDGSVHWKWINDAAIDAKVGLSNEMAVFKGGGESWGQASNVHLQPGAIPTLNVNTELDFGNEARDCEFGTADCYNLIVSTGGSHKSTTALYVISDNSGSYAVHWGIRVAGTYLASDQDIEDDAGAPVGLGFGLFGGRGHATASIQDGAAGAVSYLVTANHSIATIEDRSDSPASLSIGGHHRIGGIVEQSNSPNGLVLNGTYAGAQIVGHGFQVSPKGSLMADEVVVKSRIQLPRTAPPSSRSRCAEGELAFDRAYIYICIASDLWRRAPLVNF